jgi:hypothetical protein
VIVELLNMGLGDSLIMKRLAREVLVFERKPTVSGPQVEAPVGGEILPINSLQLLLANLWWIFLLAIPLVIYLLAARYGVRIPRHFRQALRLVPIVVLTLG